MKNAFKFFFCICIENDNRKYTTRKTILKPKTIFSGLVKIILKNHRQ